MKKNTIAEKLLTVYRENELIVEPITTEINGMAEPEIRNENEQKPILILPSDVGIKQEITFAATATEAFTKLSSTKNIYRRGSAIVQLLDCKLQVINPRNLKSIIDEAFFTCVYKNKDDEIVLAEKLITDEASGTLLSSVEAIRKTLTNVELVTKCPIITDCGVIESGAYDGVLVAGGAVEPVEVLADAVKIIEDLLEDFHFQSDADKSRAVAMLITPALKFGGLFTDRCPIFIAEADQSQAGKGYLTELTAKIYNARIASVTWRDGGVGGLDESVDMAMVTGAPFIRLDNVRGRLQSQRLESLLTESETIAARIPHTGYVEVKPSAHIWQFTANGAEATQDLMNRACIISIYKQPDDYQFKDWDGLGILKWAEQKQPKLLGAIFCIIQEWLKAGKPKTACPAHDFREWAGVTAWFSTAIFKLPAPSEGHRHAAALRADPAKAWLHALGGKILKDCAMSLFTTQELMTNSEIYEIEPPSQTLTGVGKILGKCFINDVCKLDGMEWRRRESEATRPSGQKYQRKHYSVHRIDKNTV